MWSPAPDIKYLAEFSGTADIESLSAETSVYAASPEFVRKNCGPIAIRILDTVPEDYFRRAASLGMLANIDVRVHRLNVGEYPAVPGWHCDGALRETYFGAPQVDAVPIRDTVLATVSTGRVSNFEYLVEPFTVDLPETDDVRLWQHVDKMIEQHLPSQPRQLFSQTSIDGRLYQLSVDTLHRCLPARVRGWRLFFRMSMWHNDYLGDGGKVSTQQQVYVPLGAGW